MLRHDLRRMLVIDVLGKRSQQVAQPYRQIAEILIPFFI